MFGLTLLTSLFAGSLVIASVLAAKIISIGPLFVPAGVLAYSITFACTDIIGEVYGKRTARQVVLSGFAALVAALLLIRLSVWWTPAPFWGGQEGFAQLLGTSERIIFASIIAYLVSQLTDVWLFARVRKATGGRHLWLRNNTSTILSQLIDSIVFITIAFAGVMPIAGVIFGQWLVKIAIALLDTPLVYLGVWLLRGGSGMDDGEPAVAGAR